MRDLFLTISCRKAWGNMIYINPLTRIVVVVDVKAAQ
jgi:hypothetical protein